jgi:hypothetical protein
MAAEFNLYMDQGIDFSTEITISQDDGSPVDLTNATIRSQVRRSYTSTVSFPFTITKMDQVLGKIKLSMTAAQTAGMRDGRYVYDAEYQIGDITIRFLKGLVTVYPRVTR